ncbi:hypothetical protein PYW07_000390 [Mythimna separata]|uniref:Uncharacterized protein n=1 Tax=Mythimna separata TaxID=271217 RepID=A0AAD7Z343_MYTSE|nr:hypothetical protein PYW07_000390 [Mythimna separata]
MDASASTKPTVDRTKVFNFYLSIDGIEYSVPPKLNSSVKKHTKLPDYDFDSKATWGPNSYILKPRLRKIISIDEDELLRTSRSMKTNLPATPPRTTTSSQSYTKRKFVTIAEDDENADLHPKFSKDKKPFTVKTINQCTETEKPKPTHHRLTSKLTPNTGVRSATKFSTEISRSAKTKSASVLTPRKGETYPRSRGHQAIRTTDSKIKHDRETLRSPRTSKSPLKTSEVNKTVPVSSESDKELTKNKSIMHENLKSKPINKRPIEKPTQKLPPTPQQQQQNKSPKVSFKDISSKSKPLTIIHVPIDKCKKKNLIEPTAPEVIERVIHIDCNDGIDNLVHHKDAVVETDPLPTSVSTEMRDFEVNTVTLTTCETTSQTDSKNALFDSLEIPNVTLKTDKSEPKEDLTIFETRSLPNLRVPSVTIGPLQNEEMNSSDKSICQGASYILKRATLTFTTRQKFNFQLVGGEATVGPTEPSSPLNYPANVMTVFKNGLKQKKSVKNVSSELISKKKNTAKEDYLNHLNDMKSLNCSYVYNNLMKPSDIISSIRVNNGLLQNDYICEQFQRELNFIDSFFESLQYLETCSLTEKCYSESKIENFSNNTLFDNAFDVRNSEYDDFLSKLENGTNIDDSETMASKSLCLLNLLIRDEQRRAKNLLFVLKMREDALKDFTKSQILWLEKKKKHDNTDISTLKKKQRGALLKLQHECGEMQRMRKALLALSEKRKVVLMKTKKNLELQLKNNVDVEQIILGKKKLKRNSSSDRNAAPLKCFDLSSSGCEESSTSKGTSEASPLASAAGAPSRLTSLVSVSSAEKCVQTSDAQSVDHATDTAAEHFVDVDGGYLNILFHNLSLPQIFSSGKHYEVNEEALRNIVNSANSHNTNVSGSEVVEKLMDQIKNKDLERSDRSCSSPSTARSLIDEFDQFYKDLHEEDKSNANTSWVESDNSGKVCEIKDLSVQAVEDEQSEALTSQRPGATMVTMTAESVVRVTELSPDTGEPCVCNAAAPEVMDDESNVDKEPVTTSQAPTGPLPVPVGAAAVVDSPPPDVPAWLPSKSSPPSTGSNSVSSQSLCGSVSSIVALTAPVHVEAEELRRQQLAIEREIKALEQQQCRLLVVREIPDKPPPPYTPPTEIRTPKPPRMFSPDENLLEKVERHITCPESSSEEPAEAFCVFVRDYCQESLERFKQEQSDMPWDACNLLPQKPPVEVQEMVEKTATELKDVLTTITPAAVSGVSSRRSDHIDDILFDEWRRCEPEWTALHTDEAIVKNQIFESIFQKILNNTIEEYKKSVQREVVSPN